MIEQILPGPVAVAESFGDDPSATLSAAEEALVARAVPARRSEFATGRACARRALAGLGIVAGDLGSDRQGATQWPPGVWGSITHCAGYRAAAVVAADRSGGVGIDAEPHDDLPNGVWERIASTSERLHVAEVSSRRPDVSFDRLVFSAKESVYKVYYPLTRRWLDFDEVDVRLDPQASRFAATVRPRADGGRTWGRLDGRFLVAEGLIVTAVVRPADVHSFMGQRTPPWNAHAENHADHH